jgi:hypothetical protein
VRRRIQIARTILTRLSVALFLGACSQAPSGIIELSLADVDGFSTEDHPAPIEVAYDRYKGARIAVEGIRLGPGLPPGLGSHQYVGLHQPPPRGEEFRVFISGNMPPKHGRPYRVIGRIVPSGSFYEIAVEDWQELPRD